MSHSQFHCTSRAYLDMHGLIFETSICYWQDQPGRSAVSQRQRPPPEGGRRVPQRAGRAEHGAGQTHARGGGGGNQRTPPGARKPAESEGESGRGAHRSTHGGPPQPATASEAD